MSIKLWYDDVRPAPEGWVWARTNDEAIALLSCNDVTHASLDHDMGNHDLPEGTYDGGPNSGSGMPQKGEENGYHLVQWMIKNDKLPGWIRVHSWSPSGGEHMYRALLDAKGDNVIRQPYRPMEVLVL